MATVEEFVQSCCTCVAVALCCGNSPLGPQRRIAAAQGQTDSNPAPSSLLWPRLPCLSSVTLSGASLLDTSLLHHCRSARGCHPALASPITLVDIVFEKPIASVVVGSMD